MKNHSVNKNYRLWQPEEIAYLKKNHTKEGIETAAKKFNRSIHAVKAKLTQLNLYQLNRGSWTASDDEFLRKHWGNKKPGEIGKKINRTKQAVTGRAYRLGLRELNIKKWSKNEDKYLEKSYLKMGYKELSKHLGRSTVAVTAHIRLLGLRKKNWQKWTNKKLRLLKKYYGKITAKEIADKINFTTTAVIDKANSLNLAPPRAKLYTQTELEFIKNSYPTIEAKYIAKKLGRDEKAIRHLAYKKGWKGRKNITHILSSDKIDYIKKYYKKMKVRQLANELEISENQVLVVARRFGLVEKKVIFSKKEKDFIRINHNKLSLKEIAGKLNRGKYSIRYYAQSKGWIFRSGKGKKLT